MKMKVGDSRQAILLGVVAVGAIGFLIKTAVGSFMGKVSNQPMVVKDLRGTPAPSETSPTANSTSREPESETHLSNVNQGTHSGPYFVRDAFAKIPIATSTHPTFPSNERMTNTESENQITAKNPFEGDIGNRNGSLPNVEAQNGASQDPNGANKNPTPVAPPVKARFDGYVNAGSPMGVLTYKDSSYTVAVGDTLPDGLVVIGISPDNIQIRKGKQTTKIFVGNEVEIK